tara:strand:- start:686 stop:913 length:228 start_codon:yes stop_codon:yes gene_type:complete
MNYEQFKKDSLNLNFTEFMNKWENHEKLLEFQEKKYDEDFYDYVCEYYNYDEYKIEQWKIFKNTCELYVKCLNDS